MPWQPSVARKKCVFPNRFAKGCWGLLAVGRWDWWQRVLWCYIKKTIVTYSLYGRWWFDCPTTQWAVAKPKSVINTKVKHPLCDWFHPVTASKHLPTSWGIHILTWQLEVAKRSMICITWVCVSEALSLTANIYLQNKTKAIFKHFLPMSLKYSKE